MTERLKRGRYLGGQQVAAVAGLHPYMTAADVYAHCALDIVEDISDRPAVRRGTIIEPGLIDWIEQRELLLPPGSLKRDQFVVDPDVPYFAGTIDAVQVAHDGELWLHEVTTASRWTLQNWGEDGDPDGAATYKWVQAQWYAGITGAAGATIWMYAIDGDELRQYPVPRSDTAIEELRSQAEAFWLDSVVPKTPPDLTDVEPHMLARSIRSLDKLYEPDPKATLQPTPEFVELANDYNDARNAAKKNDDDKAAAAAALKAALGEHTSSKWDGGSVSWKRNKGKKTVDHKKALEWLVAEGHTTQEIVEVALDENTKTKPGPRVLRVTIKEQQDD